MYVSSDIAEKIKSIAASRSINTAEMFIDLGLGKNTLTNFKTSFPRADNIAKIADYLGCSVDYLLGRTDRADIPSSSFEELPEEERELIDVFRSLDKSGRRRLLVQAEDESRRVTAEKGTGNAKIS